MLASLTWYVLSCRVDGINIRNNKNMVDLSNLLSWRLLSKLLITFNVYSRIFMESPNGRSS